MGRPKKERFICAKPKNKAFGPIMVDTLTNLVSLKYLNIKDANENVIKYKDKNKELKLNNQNENENEDEDVNIIKNDNNDNNKYKNKEKEINDENEINRNSKFEKIFLKFDEYETIRLIDFYGWTQEECAKHMNVARTTVQAIYENARKKIADAIVNSKLLILKGGDCIFCKEDKPTYIQGCKKLRCNKFINKRID